MKHPRLRTAAIAATLSAATVASTLMLATSAQAVTLNVNCSSVSTYVNAAGVTYAYGSDCTVTGYLAANSLGYMKYNGQLEYLCSSWSWSASVAPVPNPTYYVNGGNCRSE